MEIIVFEKDTFYKLIEELTEKNIRTIEKRYKLKEWIGEVEAKDLLGIKSKSKLRELVQNFDIQISKFGKIIRYSRSSILGFLEKHRITLEKLVSQGKM